MNSFAFWCNKRPEFRLENIPISVTVNVNLWVDRIHEKQSVAPIYLDFGFMLQRAGESNNGEKRKRHFAENVKCMADGFFARDEISLIEQIGGIELYCPFGIREDRCIDLKPRLNKDTLGAIF